MEQKYYEINETLAKASKESYSFNDYERDSATKEYQSQVDYAYELANEALVENKEKAFYLADKYAKKLADNINKRFKNDTLCPSIMIIGAGNFPTKKKQKQMERLNILFEEYEYIQNYLESIKSLRFQVIKREKQGVAIQTNLVNDYFEVLQNEELNRLQLFFKDKPTEEERTILKKNGFKWSPKNKVWQRQLTVNAITSTKRIIELFELLGSKDIQY